MPAIEKGLLVRQLQRVEPRSGLAGHLASAKVKGRMASDALEAQVEDYRRLGNTLTPYELLALQRVHTLLQAPSLFNLGENHQETLASVTQAISAAAEGKSKRPKKGAVPAFSSIGGPRHLSGKAIEGARAWTKQLSQNAYYMPLTSPDGQLLYLHDESGKIQAFRASTGKREWTLDLKVQGSSSLALSPDGQRLYAVQGYEKTQLVGIDTKTHEVVWRNGFGDPEYNEEYSTLALSPDGTRLFAVDGDGNLRAYDTDGGAELWSQQAASGGLTQAEFPVVSPDGGMVVQSDGYTKLNAFDAESGELLWTAQRGGSGGTGAFTPDGERFIVPYQNLLTAFDTETGAASWSLTLPEYFPDEIGVALTSDGERVVVYDGSESLLLVNAETGDVERKVTLPPDEYLRGTPVLLPGDTRALVITDDGSYLMADFSNGLSKKVGEGKSVSFTFSTSPDGRYAYQGSGSDRLLRAVKLDLGT